ncbi:MAG: IS66 family transposase zinc-finger binding domain-containing protein [Sodaliphilus sp.]
MIATLEEFDNSISQKIVAEHRERLDALRIDADYYVSLLRPAMDPLRRERIALIEKYKKLICSIEEKHRIIDRLENEVFLQAIENCKLEAKLDMLERGGDEPKAMEIPPAISRIIGSRPQKDSVVGSKSALSQWSNECQAIVGQPNHKGYSKEQTSMPNTTIECMPEICPECGCRLDSTEMRIVERRQIWDLPLPIAPIVTEYVRMKGTCQCGCQCVGEFPQEATAPVSYGANIHALVGYMSTLPFPSFKRMVNILNSVFFLQMSPGSVSNILQRMRKKAVKEVKAICENKDLAEVAGADAAGAKVDWQQHWVWTFQLEALTYLIAEQGCRKNVEEKPLTDGPHQADRPTSAFNAEVESSQGGLMPILNVLIYQTLTVPDSDWPAKMLEFLHEAIRLKHISPQGRIPENEVVRLRKELDELMEHIPLVEDETHQKSIQDFFLELQTEKDDLLTFLTRYVVPADIIAMESSAHPVKAKAKVSKQAKNSEGAKSYSPLRSIMQTARENNRDPFVALIELARK